MILFFSHLDFIHKPSIYMTCTLTTQLQKHTKQQIKITLYFLYSQQINFTLTTLKSTIGYSSHSSCTLCWTHILSLSHREWRFDMESLIKYFCICNSHFLCVRLVMSSIGSAGWNYNSPISNLLQLFHAVKALGEKNLTMFRKYNEVLMNHTSNA